MKRLTLLTFFVLTSIILSGQDYDVPKNYKFENKEAYKAYEPQIKETINWLQQTPLGKESNKRQEANAFFITWLTGSPNVSIDIDPRIVNFIGINPEMLVPFMTGWAKYSLENNYSKDNILGNKAGIEAVVAFYKKNRGYLKKDNNIEKYEKLISKDKLQDEIQKRLKK